MLGAARLRVLDTGQYSLAVRVLQPEKLGDGPVFQGGPIGVWRLFLMGRKHSPEEAFAALTSQGMEMIARGSVSTHHTVPRLIFLSIGHGFKC